MRITCRKQKKEEQSYKEKMKIKATENKYTKGQKYKQLQKK